MSRFNENTQWQQEARRLRKSGLDVLAISAAVHKRPYEVRLALNENGEREAYSASRSERRRRAKSRKASPKKYDPTPLRQYVEFHKPRVIKQTIDRAAIAAIIANREGGISVAELMRRISVDVVTP